MKQKILIDIELPTTSVVTDSQGRFNIILKKHLLHTKNT